MENKSERNGFEYYKDGDIFYISNNENDEEIVGSIPMGNMVYDIGVSGKVVGLEIDNASEVFGVGPKAIAEAHEARLGVRIQGGVLFIFFSINLSAKSCEFSYAIPRNKIPIAV